jgi:hypothetical protein
LLFGNRSALGDPAGAAHCSGRRPPPPSCGPIRAGAQLAGETARATSLKSRRRSLLMYRVPHSCQPSGVTARTWCDRYGGGGGGGPPVPLPLPARRTARTPRAAAAAAAPVDAATVRPRDSSRRSTDWIADRGTTRAASPCHATGSPLIDLSRLTDSVRLESGPTSITRASIDAMRGPISRARFTAPAGDR